jgi:hypothetical protein
MKRNFLLFVFVLSLPIAMSADPGFPGGGPAPDGEVPVDGGASLLVGAAVLYGTKKIRDKQNKNR